MDVPSGLAFEADSIKGVVDIPQLTAGQTAIMFRLNYTPMTFLRVPAMMLDDGSPAAAEMIELIHLDLLDAVDDMDDVVITPTWIGRLLFDPHRSQTVN